MEYLRTLNPFDIAIGVAIGTVPYWSKWFVTASLPLWSVTAAAVLGVGALFALGALRRTRAKRKERERLECERHQEIIARIERLDEVINLHSRPQSRALRRRHDPASPEP